MFAPTTKILVIDDMLTMRKIIMKTLKDCAYTDITEASDGQNGWDAMEAALNANAPFELILSDWNMPRLSGLDLLKKAKADPRFKSLPFVLITAESEKSQVIEALQAGVSNYIVKPFTPDQLKQKLEQTYAKHNPAAKA